MRTEIIEHQASGLRFKVTSDYDHDSGTPWDNDGDCHILVRTVKAQHSHDVHKKPSERVMPRSTARSGGAYHLFDFAEASKMAREGGWRGHKVPTSAGAVEELLAHWNSWLVGDWCYVAIHVVQVDADDNAIGHLGACLGGVEDTGSYVADTAMELIEELAQSIQQDAIAQQAEVEATA